MSHSTYPARTTSHLDTKRRRYRNQTLRCHRHGRGHTMTSPIAIPADSAKYGGIKGGSEAESRRYRTRRPGRLAARSLSSRPQRPASRCRGRPRPGRRAPSTSQHGAAGARHGLLPRRRRDAQARGRPRCPHDRHTVQHSHADCRERRTDRAAPVPRKARRHLPRADRRPSRRLPGTREVGGRLLPAARDAALPEGHGGSRKRPSWAS